MATPAWRIRREAPAGLEPWTRLALAWDLDPRAARLAWMRGVDEPEDLAWRLDPSWSRATDPLALAGVGAAAERIKQAIAGGESIVIYGDYDVDGVTATALLSRVLEKLGAKVSFFIPNRFNDGYGLHLDCIRDLKESRNPDLLISVDCGVRSVEEVAASAELGLEWIITDHHGLGPSHPDCLVVHPHLDGYANPHLSGVGVAFKLAQALLGDEPSFLEGLLKLVAIGTIADMVPLQGKTPGLSAGACTRWVARMAPDSPRCSRRRASKAFPRPRRSRLAWPPAERGGTNGWRGRRGEAASVPGCGGSGPAGRAGGSAQPGASGRAEGLV